MGKKITIRSYNEADAVRSCDESAFYFHRGLICVKKHVHPKIYKRRYCVTLDENIKHFHRGYEAEANLVRFGVYF